MFTVVFYATYNACFNVNRAGTIFKEFYFKPTESSEAIPQVSSSKATK
jgi:hypothetical protein